jgi:hypothetical protein
MFLPTESGARDVLRRARRRRRRQVVLSAAGVAAVTLAGTLFALPGVGRSADRLSVVPASPSPGTTATAARAPHPGDSGRPTASGQAQGAGNGAGHPASPPATVLAGPSPADSPTPTSQRRRHSAAAPITRTTVGFTSQCDATNDLAGWCEVYSGPGSARRKHPVSLSMELCRLPVAGDAQLTFDDSREVDLEVESNGTREWQAGQGVKNATHSHTVTVRGGTCLRWAATWDTIGADGFYAPPGGYGVSYGVDSSQLPGFTTGLDLTLTD